MKHPILLIVCVCTFFESGLYSQTATAPSAGSGTPEDPYEIASLENLYWIAASTSRWQEDYIQTANIDASETSTWGPLVQVGWTPIGNFTTKFTGSYDGQNYTIDGLFINREGVDFVGLFGAIYFASIMNVGLTNVSIHAGNRVGGLAGSVEYASTISNCYSTGSVSGLDRIGGLLGTTYWDGYVTADISDCYSATTVTGFSELGGLVGYSDVETTIGNCYSTGSVTGVSYVGGFVGVNKASINYSYSWGDVTRTVESSEGVGGFIGSQSGSIEYCYSTGSVTYLGETDPTDKGFVGESIGSPPYTANFFDSDASGQTSGIGAAARNTVEMKTPSTFTDSGWSPPWNMDSGINDGYPYLAWQNPDGTPLPVQIATISVQTKANGVVLTWVTVTETNNYGFEIEKRTINQHYDLRQWTLVGFVVGSGTSSSPQEYSFTDKELPQGRYAYRIKQINWSGSFSYTDAIEVTLGLPIKFALHQNYPNPFNPSTTIAYQLKTDSRVRLTIYDLLGQAVSILLDGQRSAGYYREVWDASSVASGTYICHLMATDATGKEVVGRKVMTLIK